MLRLLSKILLGAAIACGAGSRVAIAESVRVHRATGDVVHQRVAEWVNAAGFGYAHDHPDVIASREASDGRFSPAYRDERGVLVPGRRWVVDRVTGAEVPDPRDVVTLYEGRGLNVKPTAGIDFTFAQTYGTSAGANGLNYIALSNDTLTETTASTTLSTEIAANGLTRAQGTYAHTAGASTATISKTFTCATSSQAAQKAALFSAASAGTMHHALSFAQRTLQVGDTLAVTFTITIT